MGLSMRLSHALSKLEVFVRIVEEGSLSKAARALNLSPSAVSKALTTLEGQLGTTLMKRTTRQIALTESGVVLYERATSVLHDADIALNTALQYREPAGVLQVSCSVAFGCMQVSKLIRDFTAEYPRIEVALNLDDRLVDLASECIDVVLRVTARDDWDYPGRRLAPIRWIYAASPSYLDRHPPIRSPEDLREHACLLYPAMTEQRKWDFVIDGEIRSVAVPCRTVSNSSLALAEMAIDNCGVVSLPTYVAQRYLKDGSLCQILHRHTPPSRFWLYAMYVKLRYSNPSVRVFLDFLTREFAEGAPWERLAPRP